MTRPKGYVFIAKEDEHWMRKYPKYLALKYLGKSFLFRFEIHV
jgi:hypothetical protein